mmetsp:Transcript_63122/g.167820  ORF Transcript_63122/g.167820 Transcript_63122/m.167820 type:complete len:177 (-) Transcript_63122:132-662(-)
MPAAPSAKFALVLLLLLGGCPPCARAAKPVGFVGARDWSAGHPGQRPRLLRYEGSFQEDFSDDLPDGKRVVKSSDVQKVTNAVVLDKHHLTALAAQANQTYNTGLGLEEVLVHYKQMLETGATAGELAGGLKAIQDHRSAWKDAVVQSRGAIENFKAARDGLEDAIKVYGDTLEER